MTLDSLALPFPVMSASLSLGALLLQREHFLVEEFSSQLLTPPSAEAGLQTLNVTGILTAPSPLHLVESGAKTQMFEAALGGWGWGGHLHYFRFSGSSKMVLDFTRLQYGLLLPGEPGHCGSKYVLRNPCFQENCR